jgi:tyrosine-specific transport protein
MGFISTKGNPMFGKIDSKVFGSTMLIAGTSIGAAMLAMPIMTGLFGFLGTTIILIACWLFMYWTATLILEASLQFEDGTSFIGMARRVLGPWGALITWATFLLLFYALVAAYLTGSGHIIIDAVEHLLKIKLPPFFDILPLLVVFAPFIYFGLSLVDHLNRFLMVGMFVAYGVIIIWLLPSIHANQLFYVDSHFALLSFSVVVTSFGYHVIIPTIVTYLDRDVKRIKRCIFFGSFIPLLIYFFWEFSILGSVPVRGPHGLAHAFLTDEPLAKILHTHINNNFISGLARGFSIFAIVTSFLGVAQGLFDFLKDGLRAHGSHKKRIVAFVLTFLPPVFFIVILDKGFIVLLEYAGALVSIILGIIPILIVWRLRKEPKHVYRAPGNYAALFLGILFFAFVVALVILRNAGILNFNVEELVHANGQL